MNQATTEIWGETSLICLKTNTKSKLNSLFKERGKKS